MNLTPKKSAGDAGKAKPASRMKIRIVWFVAISLALAISLAVVLLNKEDPSDLGYVGPDRAPESFQRAAATGPLRPHPSNPRYFTDGTGKAIYLTGSHVWNNLQDIDPPDFTYHDGIGPLPEFRSAQPAEFDFAGHLRILKMENHNFIRLWFFENAAWAPWTSRTLRFRQLPYFRTGPGVALDGSLKFDVTRFDQAFFDRLRSRVSEAGRQGFYVSVMLFQGWSLERKSMTGNPWRGHPFHCENNVNSIDGDSNRDDEGKEIQTLSLPPIARLQEKYVRKVIDTLNDLDNVLWEITNESDPASKEWQYDMIRFIKDCEAAMPKQHPVGMTAEQRPNVFCSNADLFDSPADWISPGGENVEDYRANPPSATGAKVILVDTDHLWGVGGDRAWVWKSFCRGLNVLFMDPLDTPKWEAPRRAMGHTLAYANRLDLAVVTPRGDLASTGFCLAKPGTEYLVYLPFEAHPLESARVTHRFKRPIRNFRRLFPSEATLDMSAVSGEFRVEWFNPSTGEAINGKPVTGGGTVSFKAPFRGDAVLYLKNSASK